jgi:hypothetical protein
MKDAEQNSIDLLLRSFARRNTGTKSHDSREVFSENSAHLDADELNAFAEGMLPAPARTRYTDHLADCANCRSVVIQLSSAAGVAVERKEVEKRSITTFWERITAISAQPLLRYALPAIVLASILGIGLLALRNEGPGDFVAQHQPSAQPQNLNESNPAMPAGSPAQIETVSKDTAAPTTRTATVPVEGSKGETAGTSRGRADAAVPKSIAGAEQPAEATPTFAPDVNAPAAPPPLRAYTARDSVGTLSKEDSFKREAPRARTEEDKLQTNDADTGNRQAAAKSAANPSTGGVQGLITERRAYGVKNKKDSAAEDETRTVSGKRFVHKGDAWVDTAYNGSATTNVKRGSEQYRALVADEPSIHMFADQLGGQVIVVWKGRAYRIR